MHRSRLRRPVQIFVLGLFVVLAAGVPLLGAEWLTAGPLSRLDPLVGLSAVLASRAFIVFWTAALVTIALTVAFGRAWCGWICPLGTVLDLAVLPVRSRRPSRRWRLGKYVALVVVLGAALLGSMGPMVLDPMSIITRPLQEIAGPYFGNDAVGRAIGADLGWNAVHTVAFLALVSLLAVVLLNLVERRFWCLNLCPLGGLLALLSKVPGVRRTVHADACTSCARCAKTCPTGAISAAAGFRSDPAECITCLKCADACKTSANAFEFMPAQMRLPDFEPSRRDAVTAIGLTGVGLAAAVLPVARTQTEIIRPPSTSEARLARLCVRCGACYAACPTGVLIPSVSLTSEAGLWTPMLEQRPPYCTLNCNRCATACPTDALHTPTTAEASALGLGVKAAVKLVRCRAWASNHECMLCQGVCPIAGALVGIERPAGLARRPGSAPVTVPVVVPDLCVGCNQCATVCPAKPPAIGAPLLPDLPAGSHGIPGMPVPGAGMRRRYP